jgi:hypothetical protein
MINHLKLKNMKKVIGLLAIALLAGLSACSNDNNDTKKSQVQFSLTDAPSLKGYQALYLDVKGLCYIVGDSTEVSLPINPAIINLLDLTNGRDTLLANVELEAGQKVSQVRLILGDNNTLVLADGSSVKVKVPSGETSGLKFNIQSTAATTSGYKVLIDFNAEKSIVAKGNGSYSLKPVIRGYIVANTSKIYGHISPSNVPFEVMTVMNGDTLVTVSDTLQNNYFMLHGLISGSYDVQFIDSTGTVCKTLTQDIIGGTDIDMGTVQIE